MASILVTPEAISRLKSQLLISNLQQKDPPLFQVINQLIGIVQANSSSISSNGSVGPSGPSGKDGIPGFILTDSGGDNNDISIPGPTGATGASGTIGRDGAAGPTIIDTEVIEEFITTIPGPQGNIGNTGPQGPIGGIWPLEDGLDGDQSYIPGPAGANGASGSSDIVLVRVPLTELQIESWSTVPIQLVAAQGANKIAVPLNCSIQFDLTTAYTSAPSVSLFWGAGNFNLLAATIASNLNAGAPSSRINSSMGANLSSDNYSTLDPRNNSINLKGSANPTNPGTGVATAVVNLVYAVITTQ